MDKILPDPEVALAPSILRGLRFWGLGFGIWGLGFRVWGLGFLDVEPQRIANIMVLDSLHNYKSVYLDNFLGLYNIRGPLSFFWVPSCNGKKPLCYRKH